jgi:hypothetical protein
MVIITVLASIDRKPYSGFSGEVGSQRVEVRNSLKPISLKAGTEV